MTLFPEIAIFPPILVSPRPFEAILPELLTVSATILIVPPLLTMEVVETLPEFLITDPINCAAELAAIIIIPPGASTIFLLSIKDL